MKHTACVSDEVKNSEKPQPRGTRILKIDLKQFIKTSLLTVCDMCKAVDRGMRIDNLRLVEKSGGKSGHWTAP